MPPAGAPGPILEITALILKLRDDSRGLMSNQKKPKKEKPKVVHGASYANRNNDLASHLLTPDPKPGFSPAKKKK
jgi:hypothetical protein